MSNQDIKVTFSRNGHGARHLRGTGLSVGDLESAIVRDLQGTSARGSRIAGPAGPPCEPTTHVIVPPRGINSWERRTLERLLSSDFPGAKELRLQLQHTRVSEEYSVGDPTVIFVVDQNAAPVASVDGRIPVEAEAKDEDGMPILALLHVIDGYLWELEFWRGDGDVIQRLPEPTSLNITTSHQDPLSS